MQINPKPTVSNVGGKAYQLYRLQECSTVPPFFVVSFEDPNETNEPVGQRAILAECEAHEFELMAVRSSASCEDSADTSFAGMFETVLNVGPGDVIDAISRVLCSVRSRRVAEYCEAHGLNPHGIHMAVIIQRMVRSRVSGVCFTRLKPGSSSLIIEACYGLCEPLVSGAISPDAYVVDRTTLKVIEESIGYQTRMLSPDARWPSKATYEWVPFHRRNARKLVPGEIAGVAKASLEAEKCLGLEAADVEWALERDSLFVVQARPFSGLQR